MTDECARLRALVCQLRDAALRTAKPRARRILMSTARFLQSQIEDEEQAAAMVQAIDMAGGDAAFLDRYLTKEWDK